MNFDLWPLKFDLWTAKAAWKHTDGPKQLLTFSLEPVLHTGPTGVNGTITTDPSGTIARATGLAGPRLMGTDSASPEPWLPILLKPEPQPVVLLV